MQDGTAKITPSVFVSFYITICMTAAINTLMSNSFFVNSRRVLVEKCSRSDPVGKRALGFSLPTDIHPPTVCVCGHL